MHQSFVTTTSPAPGNSGDFDFGLRKSLIESLPCGDIQIVRPPVNSPALRGCSDGTAIGPAIFGAKQNPGSAGEAGR